MTEMKKKPDDVRAAARLMYESTPLTFPEIAAEFSVSDRTVKRWSKADGNWRKLAAPGISNRAHQAADKIAAATADAPDLERSQAVAGAIEEAAVDERAALLSGHRKQWRVVEGLVAEAVRKRDLPAARLAEVISRTINTKQQGERKAWGLEASEPPQTLQIVIERE